MEKLLQKKTVQLIKKGINISKLTSLNTYNKEPKTEQYIYKIRSINNIQTQNKNVKPQKQF